MLPIRISWPLPSSPPYIALHTRSSPCAHPLALALLSSTGEEAPLPALQAVLHEARAGGQLVHVTLPLALPLGPCFDALASPAALPFSMAAAASSPGLPGCQPGSAGVLEAFTSSLRAAELLRHAAMPAAAGAAANAALPTARIRSALEEALHGGAGAAAPRAPLPPATVLVPLRIVLRAAASGGGPDTLAVVQEGAPCAGVSLLAAITGALARGVGYVPEARSVILAEEGMPLASATHCALVQGVQVQGVAGMWGSAVGQVAAAAALPDGWLYVSLQRTEGFGRLGM